MCTTGEPAALSGGVPARINAAIGFWRLAGVSFAFGERSAIPSGPFPREDFPHVGGERLVFPPRRACVLVWMTGAQSFRVCRRLLVNYGLAIL